MTEPVDDDMVAEWHARIPRWLIAEKVRIESPLFNGEMIVEDVVQETHNTITYKMVSDAQPPSLGLDLMGTMVTCGCFCAHCRAGDHPTSCCCTTSSGGV